MNMAIGMAVYKVAAYNVENADIDSQKNHPSKRKGTLATARAGNKTQPSPKTTTTNYISPDCRGS